MAGPSSKPDPALLELFAVARDADLSVAEFDARLWTIHTVVYGDDANAVGMVARRQAASRAYADLTRELDRHHDLERLAEALGVQSP